MPASQVLQAPWPRTDPFAIAPHTNPHAPRLEKHARDLPLGLLAAHSRRLGRRFLQWGCPSPTSFLTRTRATNYDSRKRSTHTDSHGTAATERARAPGVNINILLRPTRSAPE